jgi:hypothetical protein
MNMNQSVVISLALAAILSAGANILRAESSNTTTAISAPLLLIENRPAVSMDIPAPPPTARTPFLLKLILNPTAGIRDRLEAIRELDDNLDPGQIDALYSFLKSHPDSRETNPSGLRTLKNNVLNALRNQIPPPAGLTATLIDIFHDRAQDFVTRDYAVQHLTSWYSRSAADSPDAKERIQTTLKEAVREKTSISGTALLGLHRLSLSDRSFNGPEIDRSALRMATSSDTPLAARITAIQVCAERGLVQALPEIKRFAGVRGQTALQISAIAALGKLGGAEDALMLQRLENEGDIALRPAIAAALKLLPRTLASRETY